MFSIKCVFHNTFKSFNFGIPVMAKIFSKLIKPVVNYVERP